MRLTLCLQRFVSPRNHLWRMVFFQRRSVPPLGSTTGGWTFLQTLVRFEWCFGSMPGVFMAKYMRAFPNSSCINTRLHWQIGVLPRTQFSPILSSYLRFSLWQHTLTSTKCRTQGIHPFWTRKQALYPLQRGFFYTDPPRNYGHSEQIS